MMADAKAKRTSLPLTLRNVVKAVEKVEDWRGLGDNYCLRVPDSKLDQIERRHSSNADRMTAVIEYWLLTDPTPSWRRLIYALDYMREHEVADMVRPYAEPLTDSTLTFENVTRVTASVIDWNYLGEWIGVPEPKLHQIWKHYITRKQKMAAMAREWLDSSPNVSWTILAGGLYCMQEEAALEEVKGYLQKQQDSTLTVANLWNTVKGVGLWFRHFLSRYLHIPFSKQLVIADQSSSEPEKQQSFLEYWITTHPAPSWMLVAEALYQLMKEEDAHQALEMVRKKYLRGISLYELCLQYIIDDYEYFSPLVHHLPSPVQRWIIQRWKIHCDSDSEYWELVTAEKRTTYPESGSTN